MQASLRDAEVLRDLAQQRIALRTTAITAARISVGNGLGTRSIFQQGRIITGQESTKTAAVPGVTLLQCIGFNRN